MVRLEFMASHPAVTSHTLHFRQPGEGNSNRAKLGPEQGTKQPIPPTLRIDRYPGHFGVLLIKIHLLAFVVGWLVGWLEGLLSGP